MDSATWCPTPAAVSAARRLRPEVPKNSSTALSSNEGELARSITTCAPATDSLRPSPVMVLTPLLGEAGRTSWPPWRRMATAFEPIRPEPPMTTIFTAHPPSGWRPLACDLAAAGRASGLNLCHQDDPAVLVAPAVVGTKRPSRRTVGTMGHCRGCSNRKLQPTDKAAFSRAVAGVLLLGGVSTNEAVPSAV